MFQLNPADVVKQSRYQLATFIHRRMVEDGIQDPPSVDQLLDSQYPRCLVNHPLMEWAKTLQRSLDEDRELHRLIEKISHDVEKHTICQVVQTVINDKVINWGRLAAIFCFANKMAVRDQYNVAKIRWIIEAVVESDEITQWIADNGGWEADAAMQLYSPLKVHLSNYSYHVMFALAAGGVVCGVAYLWNRLQE